MRRGTAITLCGLAIAAAFLLVPMERLMPQAEPLPGEACPSRSFAQIGGQQFGAYNATDLGKAVAVFAPRGQSGGIRCRGLLDRLDCQITRTGLIQVKTQQRVTYFEIPDGRTARVRAHRQVTSCILDPAITPPASE